jgi:hypothetical protein
MSLVKLLYNHSCFYIIPTIVTKPDVVIRYMEKILYENVLRVFVIFNLFSFQLLFRKVFQIKMVSYGFNFI